MENLDFEFSEVVKNLNGKFKMTALDEDIVILADDIIGFTSDYSVAQLVASLGAEPLLKEFYVYEKDTYRNTGKVVVQI